MRSSKLKHEHVLIASTFVGFTYIHYAFDRADMAHMSLAIAPLLIGLFSLSQSQLIRSRPTGAIVHRYLLVLVLFTTVFSAGKYSPWNQANVLIQASRGEWTGYKQHSLRGENLLWPRQAAELIKKVQSLDRRLFGESDAVFVAPMPGLYTVLAKQSPTNHLFFTLSVTTVKQREMIVQIQDAKVKWAIIRPDDAIDGRDDLRFRNAYSLVWKYMTENFEIFEDHELPSGTFLMKRRK